MVPDVHLMAGVGRYVTDEAYMALAAWQAGDALSVHHDILHVPLDWWPGCVTPCIVLTLHRYEVEAMYFDSHVRAEHQADLQTKLTAAVSAPFKAQLGLLAAEQLSVFDKDFKLALLDRSAGGFSAAADKTAAEALAGFDARVQELLVAGTGLTGEEGQQRWPSLRAVGCKRHNLFVTAGCWLVSVHHAFVIWCQQCTTISCHCSASC